MSGDVEDLGLESSGDGDPVERLRAPLGSTFKGIWICWSSRSSLNAGLIVISGRSLFLRSGLLGPVFTVRLNPARDSRSSLSFSCHSRA